MRAPPSIMEERVETILATIPRSVIKRYIREYQVTPADAEAHYRELVKFLIACSEHAASLTPSQIVDDAWHNFILFTSVYAQWCRETFGMFINHLPDDLEDDEESATDDHDNHYVASVGLLAARYGINTKLWLTAGRSKDRCNCNFCKPSIT